MPIKGVLLIMLSAVIVAVLKRDAIWEWLNDNGDFDNTNKDEE